MAEKSSGGAIPTGGDPSGVPRPVETERLEKSEGNSGIFVGEKVVPVVTANGTVVQSPQTAFIKVYQDAGVIGLAMLTLLALCVLLGMFCLRLLRQYSLLTASQDNVSNSRTVAVEKLATAVLLVRSETTSLRDSLATSVAKIDKDHQDTTRAVDELRHMVELSNEKTTGSFLLLNSLVQGIMASATHNISATLTTATPPNTGVK